MTSGSIQKRLTPLALSAALLLAACSQQSFRLDYNSKSGTTGGQTTGGTDSGTQTTGGQTTGGTDSGTDSGTQTTGGQTTGGTDSGTDSGTQTSGGTDSGTQTTGGQTTGGTDSGTDSGTQTSGGTPVGPGEALYDATAQMILYREVRQGSGLRPKKPAGYLFNFSAIDRLPAGLVVHSSTGEIYGIPAELTAADQESVPYRILARVIVNGTIAGSQTLTARIQVRPWIAIDAPFGAGAQGRTNVILVVDSSGSMSTELQWLGEKISTFTDSVRNRLGESSVKFTLHVDSSVRGSSSFRSAPSYLGAINDRVGSVNKFSRIRAKWSELIDPQKDLVFREAGASFHYVILTDDEEWVPYGSESTNDYNAVKSFLIDNIRQPVQTGGWRFHLHTVYPKSQTSDCAWDQDPPGKIPGRPYEQLATDLSTQEFTFSYDLCQSFDVMLGNLANTIVANSAWISLNGIVETNAVIDSAVIIQGTSSWNVDASQVSSALSFVAGTGTTPARFQILGSYVQRLAGFNTGSSALIRVRVRFNPPILR